VGAVAVASLIFVLDRRSQPRCGVPSPFRRVKLLTPSHACVRAHLRLSSFSFFAFTSSPTLRKSLTDCTIRVKAWGENRGFSSEIGEPSADNALIFNRFAFTSGKNHIHSPFRGVEIGGSGILRRKKRREHEKHTHTSL